MTVNLILHEGEIVRSNENFEESSDFTYHKKDTETDTSLYDRLFNSLNELGALYNPTVQRINETVIEENYKVTGDTRVILIIEHEDDEI